MRENVGEMFARRAYVKTIETLSDGIDRAQRQVRAIRETLAMSPVEDSTVHDQIEHLSAILAAVEKTPTCTGTTRRRRSHAESGKAKRCNK
jgi:hypothetical protein